MEKKVRSLANGNLIMREMFDVRQAAEYIGVCEKTIRTMVREKAIPYLKIGALIRFNRNSINEWIEAKEIKPHPKDDSAKAIASEIWNLTERGKGGDAT